MTFSEFLIADNSKNLVLVMKNTIEIKQIIVKLKIYYRVGGYPEVVYKDIEKVNKIQKNILDSYTSDFSIHTDSNVSNRSKIQ